MFTAALRCVPYIMPEHWTGSRLMEELPGMPHMPGFLPPPRFQINRDCIGISICNASFNVENESMHDIRAESGLMFSCLLCLGIPRISSAQV